MKDFNLRPDTMKLLEENTEEMLQDIGLGKVFFFLCARAQKHRKPKQK